MADRLCAWEIADDNDCINDNLSSNSNSSYDDNICSNCNSSYDDGCS